MAPGHTLASYIPSKLGRDVVCVENEAEHIRCDGQLFLVFLDAVDESGKVIMDVEVFHAMTDKFARRSA